ncbi:MAG: hypothetical protein CMP91_11685 [Gammaproteobacteria bacterium]|nr:hypothetical protein [Gammaproteobacteria bacterium]MAY02230.1 hypothetical protein [Gammaproteobacteria bacterium]|tara:strand:- start:39599 stop:40399 length:801 start_codon:yes stop_codon:yes gene_type:complete
MKTISLCSLLLSTFLIIPVFAQERTQESRQEFRPEAEFHMARVVYNNGYGPMGRNFALSRRGNGWWAIDYPEAEEHFLEGLARLSRINVAPDSHHLSIMEDEIFDHPWLFIQQIGQGGWDPGPQEVARWREYLYRGGFLVVDDFHGAYQWQTLQRVMQKIFPERAIVDLSSSDEVFNVLYVLDQVTQIPGRRHLYRSSDGRISAQLEGPQAWRGIYDDQGRLMVAINFNMDMGDAWEHADDPVYPQPMTALAYRFGLNYVIYAFTH